MSEISTIENGKVQLSLSISADDYTKALDSAYRRLGGKYPIPGFRRGKAPRRMIEASYGKNIFWDDEFDALVSHAYSAALDEHNLNPELPPEMSFKSVSETDGVTFNADVVLHPEVELGQYRGIEVPMQEYNVTDAMVDAELDKHRHEMARLVPSEAPVKEGDTVKFDFAGYVDGEAFEGGSAEDYTMVIGSHSFIPGFEEQMVGMTVDEERDVIVTFPEDYHAEHLAGKPATFKVKVHEISAEELPALDDDFAADTSDFNTLEELRADTRKNLEKQAEQDKAAAFESAVLQKAIDNAKVDIHPEIISAEAHEELHSLEEQLKSFNADLESYAQYMGTTLDDLHERYHNMAEQQLRARYVIQAIIDAEKLEPSDADYENAIRAYAERQKDWDDAKTEDMLKPENRIKFAQAALYEAVVRLLKDSAVKINKEEV